MEISNNRIKVTSMKTFAKFFLHFSLVILSCLTAGCTSEVETIGGTPETPENPQANDPNRRSVAKQADPCERYTRKPGYHPRRYSRRG